MTPTSPASTSERGPHVWDDLIQHHKPDSLYCGWVIRRTLPTVQTSLLLLPTPPYAKGYFSKLTVDPRPKTPNINLTLFLDMQLCCNSKMSWKQSYSKARKNNLHDPSCHYHLCTNNQVHVWHLCNVCFFDSSVKKMTSGLQNEMVSTLSLAAMSPYCMERQECTGLLSVYCLALYAQKHDSQNDLLGKYLNYTMNIIFFIKNEGNFGETVGMCVV